MLLQETLIMGMNCNRQLVSQRLQWTKQNYFLLNKLTLTTSSQYGMESWSASLCKRQQSSAGDSASFLTAVQDSAPSLDSVSWQNKQEEIAIWNLCWLREYSCVLCLRVYAQSPPPHFQHRRHVSQRRLLLQLRQREATLKQKLILDAFKDLWNEHLPVSVPLDSREVSDLEKLICPRSIPQVSLLNPSVSLKSKGLSLIAFLRASWCNRSCAAHKNS